MLWIFVWVTQKITGIAWLWQVKEGIERINDIDADNFFNYFGTLVFFGKPSHSTPDNREDDKMNVGAEGNKVRGLGELISPQAIQKFLLKLFGSTSSGNSQFHVEPWKC